MSQLLLLNPKRRRKAKKASSGKRRTRRTAAQRAATARLVALNKGHGRSLRRNPTRKKSRRASPVAKASRRRRSVSSRFAGARAFGMNSVVPMLKSAAIGGSGALVNDIAYGQAGRILPASMMSPVNADGSTNWMYFAGKAGMAIAIGTLGRRVPVVGRYAPRMAEGALDVLAYQVIRGVAAGMLPASLQMAAYNPVPLMAPKRMGAYVPTARRQLGAYVNTGAPTPLRPVAARKLA